MKLYLFILQTRSETAEAYGQATGVLLVTITGAILYYRWKKKNK